MYSEWLTVKVNVSLPLYNISGLFSFTSGTPFDAITLGTGSKLYVRAPSFPLSMISITPFDACNGGNTSYHMLKKK